MDEPNTQEAYLDQLQNEMRNDNLGGSDYGSGVEFNSFDQPNLIQWQLELKEIVQEIKNLLEGSELGEDANGNVVMQKPKDDNLIILNPYGVKLVMTVIQFYLNRNTILSYYKEERIKKILHDLGHKLKNVMYVNYEKMGMDTQEKKSRYPMLVMNILHTIESAYNRALMGRELESLRTARTVNQSDNTMGSAGMYSPQMQRPQKRFNLFKPSTYI